MDHAQLNAVVCELDAASSEALLAFERRDAIAAMTVYADDLEYTQANGRTINRRQLLDDIRKQLQTIHSFKSTSHRETVTFEENRLTDVSAQHASIEVKVFWMFRKNWHLYRRCKRWWRQTEAGWRIYKVEVIEESIV